MGSVQIRRNKVKMLNKCMRCNKFSIVDEKGVIDQNGFDGGVI
jgi:hypothetical protein